MSIRKFVVGGAWVTAAAASALACSAAPGDETTGSEAAQTVGSNGGSTAKDSSSKWYGPEPGTEANAISDADKDTILTAWKKVKHDFYDTTEGYSSAASKPPSTEISQCLSACPANWGDLVCHFYSTHPSYSPVTPNIRACFTYVSTGVGGIMRTDLGGRKLYYPEVYDYCVYQDADFVTQTKKPAYDKDLIEKNRSDGNKIGALTWVENNEAAAFKYIMNTWYDPFIFDAGDEQGLINEFYGVELSKPDYTASDTADVAACRAKRPLRPSDPIDGTHCSTTAKRSLAIHGSAPTFISWLKDYKNGKRE